MLAFHVKLQAPSVQIEHICVPARPATLTLILNKQITYVPFPIIISNTNFIIHFRVPFQFDVQLDIKSSLQTLLCIIQS